MKRIKVNKELIQQLKPYWQELEKIQNEYFGKIFKLEKKMSKKTGIKDLEFFMCDNYYCGIGNDDRTMRLIHSNELEEKRN